MVNRILFSILLFTCLSAFYLQPCLAQPANDNCNAAAAITISNGGFGLGMVTTTPVDIRTATVQPGEYFYPIITNNLKSVWYYFTIATSRRVDIRLAQTSGLPSAFVGMTVYQSLSCPPFPGANDVLADLTRNDIGSKFRGCLAQGTYYIQVSANNYAFLDNIFLEVTTSPTSFNNSYDLTTTAHNFQTFSALADSVTYIVGCQSIDNTTENQCPALPNSSEYTQSTWHTFTTDNHVDILALIIGPTGSAPFTTGTFGYNFYEGNVRTTPVASLILVDGCARLDYPAANKKEYLCNIKPNTAYSVQLLFHSTFNAEVKLKIKQLGNGPTQAPVPALGSMSVANQVGILVPSVTGNTYTVNDHLACNARLTLPAVQCGTTNVQNGAWNLTTWVSFELNQYINLYVTADQPGIYTNSNLHINIYNDEITNNCTDVAASTLFNSGRNTVWNFCMPPGKYSMQILGRSMLPNLVWDNDSSNFGRPVSINLIASTMRQSNLFNLSAAGAYNQINTLQPLANNITYNGFLDMFGCDSTVLPQGATSCNPDITRGIYRVLNLGSPNPAIPDSGVLTISNINIGSNGEPPQGFHMLYGGNANNLAVAQNAHTHASVITGLTPISSCISNISVPSLPQSDSTYEKFCLTPGAYTFATFGGNQQMNHAHAASFTFTRDNTTAHGTPATAENLGVLSLANSTVLSDIDYFSCRDNPINWPGVCVSNYSKVIYREFYLQDPASLDIVLQFSGTGALFSGRVSTGGLAGLSIIGNSSPCNLSSFTGDCIEMSPGWYTLLILGNGASYTTNQQYTQARGGVAGDSNRVTISVVPVLTPKYNRPYKACYAGLLTWGPNTNTGDYPDNDRNYPLCVETFGCDADTPFSGHPIAPCSANIYNRIAYYVFSISQPSFVVVDNITGSHLAYVFGFDVRTDSTKMLTVPPIQPCFTGEGFIQLCNLQPGFYTLAVLASDAHIFQTLQPYVYIDSVGISKYDHAINAYDFGVITANNNWYNGQNHLTSTPGIAPSNDFFFCSTGARQSDPDINMCYDNLNHYEWNLNNNIYPFRQNYNLFYAPDPRQQPRRNLWYTFVLDKKGACSIRIDNKTPDRTVRYPFSVWKGNGAGIDSTYGQGLIFSGTNMIMNSAPCNTLNFITFLACDIDTPTRYYILVDNPSASIPPSLVTMRPNNQLEVNIKHDSIYVKYDHCYTANVINGLGQTAAPYTNVPLPHGEFEGARGSFYCADADAGDYTFGRCNPSNNYNRTLWYKFETLTAGTIQIAYEINNSTRHYLANEIILLKDNDTSILDCSASGLTRVPLNSATTGGHTWGEGCFSPGTYYILLTGCNNYDELTPVVRLISVTGDFCNDPGVIPLNGVSTSSGSLIADCHTMGGDFGEDGQNLLCMGGIGGFKSSWFRVDLTGTEKYNVEFSLNGTINMTPVYYRVLYGNCGAMSVDPSSCSSLHNGFTLECLYAGSYYVQVFSPANATGSITLNVTSVENTNATCSPVTPNFSYAANCFSDTVYFMNYSAGVNLKYKWTFGSTGLQSTDVNPWIILQRTTTQTIQVTLEATDTIHSVSADTTFPVTIYPSVTLGHDTTLCFGDTLTVLPSANGSFAWSDGTVGPSITVTDPGIVWLEDSQGCRDSLVVDFTGIPIVQLSDVSICPGDTVTLDAGNPGAIYAWSTNDTTQTIKVSAAGTYHVSISFVLGCSLSDTAAVTLQPSPVRTRFAQICDGESFSAGGGMQTASGTYIDTIPAAIGCDTIVTTHLTVHPDTTININAMICHGDSFFAGGAFQFVTGSYFDTFVSAHACDSIVITNLTVLTFLTTTIDTQICNGESYPAGGGLQTTTATYYDTLLSIGGCDSIVITNLTVLPVFNTTVNAEICDGESYLAGGGLQTLSGTYLDTLSATSGCDSIITTNLTVKPNAVTNITASICAGDSFFAGGGFQYSAGAYVDSFNAMNGCDSIVITNLSILNPIDTTISIQICAGDSLFAGGDFQRVAGTYYDTLIAQNGCDSIVTTQLGVLSAVNTIIAVEICNGDSFLLDGVIQTTGGTYYDTLTTAAGCDSIITVNLTILNHAATTVDRTICSGDSLFAGGNYQETAGTYFDTLTAQNGCDSIITTNLSITDTITTSIDTAVCAGAGVFAGGALQTTSGVYYDTFTTNAGCDSIVITSLTILAHANTTLNVQLCAGDSLFAGGDFQISTGTYFDTLQASNGCDSIITTNLLVLNTSDTTLHVNICDGETYLAAGALQTTSGIYIDTFTGQNSCDSIVTTNLTVLNHSAIVIDLTICASDSILAGGGFQTSAGTYFDTLQAFNGCDSVITTNLTVLNRLTTSIDTSICFGDSVFAGGDFQNTGGIYYDTLQAANCDSLVITTLVVHSLPASSITASKTILCLGDSATLTASGGTQYLWNTMDTTAAIQIIPLADSMLTVSVTLGVCSVSDSILITVSPIPSTAISNDTSVCAGIEVEFFASGGVDYDWSTGDETQTITTTQPGTYVVSVISVNGCVAVDSTHLFNYLIPSVSGLTENPLCAGVHNGNITTTVSGGTAPIIYNWSNGKSQPHLDSISSGTYSLTVVDANTCSDTISFLLVAPDSIAIQTVTPIDVTCNGYEDGSLSIITSGGLGTMQYSIDGGVNFLDAATFNDLPPGEYHITVRDSNNCTAIHNEIVTIHEPAPIELDLVPDSSQIQSGDPIDLIATVSNAQGPIFYNWTPAEDILCSTCPQTTASPLETTVYTVQVVDSVGCTASVSAIVFVAPDENKLYIPNAFTPNGDGINDYFVLYGINIASINLKIFDRWGEKVFETDDIQTGWDGTFRGVALNPGVFVFYVEVEYFDGVPIRSEGSITLIR